MPVAPQAAVVARRQQGPVRAARHRGPLLAPVGGGGRADLHVAGRGDIVIETITAGNVLGWPWLFPPYRWTFGAVVAAPGRALVFDAAVRRLMADDAELGRDQNAQFLMVMADRLEAARRCLVDLYAYRRRDDSVATAPDRDGGPELIHAVRCPVLLIR